MFGVPVTVFHRFVGPSATMRVKLAALFPLVNASGPIMDKAETVTLFNDLCVFAPGALISPNITWREIDANTVRATFTNLAHTVSAELSFNAAGELIDFVADGRGAMSADGSRLSRCAGQRHSVTIAPMGSIAWRHTETACGTRRPATTRISNLTSMMSSSMSPLLRATPRTRNNACTVAVVVAPTTGSDFAPFRWNTACQRVDNVSGTRPASARDRLRSSLLMLDEASVATNRPPVNCGASP